MPGTLYPLQADDNTSLPNPGANDSTENTNNLLDHNYQHSTANDAIKAIQAKLGVGGGTPGADGQLLCVVAGKTVWQSYAVGGDLTGTLPNPTLASVAGVAGSYGSSTKVPSITVDTKGRITSVSEVTIVGGGGGGGGAASPLTTKGDIWVFGPADTRLPIGSNGQILTADSTSATGMKWAAAPAAGVWGQITGTLANQTDLAAALAAKANSSSLATVATSGSYTDLINKPTIPAAQVNSDWNAASGVAQILNKPTLGSLALLSTVSLTANVTGILPVANGGTNASTAAGARTSLGAAASGSNSDITALTATPVITGGTATADPTAALGLVTKQYVDNRTTTTLVRNETPGGLINSSNTAYTTASTFATGSLKVYLNGQRLAPGSGIDYVEGTQGFTMQYAPDTGDVLLVDYETTNSAFIQGSNSIVVQETPTGTVNGSNTAFTTLLGKYVANTLEVFINGLQQVKTTDYVETTPGSGIFTFVTAPATGDLVRISYQFSTGASGNADTTDGFHASATPGAGQLLALNSRAQSGEWWEELGRVTAGGSVASLASGTIVAKKYLKIIVLSIAAGTLTSVRVQFNGDTASNYVYRISDNGGADSTGTFAGIIADIAGLVNYVELTGVNVSSIEKFFTGEIIGSNTNGTATPPVRRELFAKWVNTSAPITQVTVVGISSNLAAGSELIILGHD